MREAQDTIYLALDHHRYEKFKIFVSQGAYRRELLIVNLEAVERA